MKIHTVLFDLDGTITDSGPGIMGGVRYALRKCGRDIPDESDLRTFIGPPLKEQFRDFCGITDAEAADMVTAYREYYSDRGIFENRVYEGVIPLLKSLKSSGIRVLMATSKPEKYAKQIAEHFDFAPYFDFIGGSRMDGSRTIKQEVIEYVLNSCMIHDRKGVLMIGDRSYDIIGAKNAGVLSMGVLYGYGSPEELGAVSPDYIADSPREAGEIISKLNTGEM